MPAMPVPYRHLFAWSILLGGLFAGWSLGDRLDSWELAHLLIAILFVTSKVATLICLSPADRRKWTPSRFALYLLWPGMRPGPFLSPPAEDSGPRPTNVGLLLNLGTGVLLVWVLPPFFPPGTPFAVRVWMSYVGVVFLALFAMMDACTILYRALGIPVTKLWVSPITAVSVRDFWGSRWNRIFSGMFRDILFKPLARPLGPVGAALAVFLYSGLLHESFAVVSRAGYGGPTAYFLLQAVGFLAEGTRRGRALLHARPFLGWCWAAAVVVGPLPLLVPPAFVDAVVVPTLVRFGVPGIGSSER
jgi:Membrane bound O-acyl transferase family